jgi:hypothetical protein
MKKELNAKKQRPSAAEPQPKMIWPQKNAKDHKVNKRSKFLSMCSLRSFAAKSLPKMQTFRTLHCKGAKAACGIGPLTNAYRIASGKILLASSRLRAFALKSSSLFAGKGGES